MGYKKRKDTARANAMEKASQFHRAFNLTTNIEDFLRKHYDKEIQFEFEVYADCAIVRFKAIENNPAVPKLGIKQESLVVDTYEGYCTRYNIEPRQAIDNIIKFLREKKVREKVLTP